MIRVHVGGQDAGAHGLEGAFRRGKIALGRADLNPGAGRLLQEEEAGAVPGIPGEEEIPPVVQFAVSDEGGLLHQVVVPVGDVRERHGSAVPVPAGRLQAVENRLAGRLDGHVGGRFDVFAVGGVVGAASQGGQAAAKVRVAGNGRDPFINAILPAHLQAGRAAENRYQQTGGPVALRRNLAGFHPAVAEMVAGEGKVGVSGF